MFHLNDMTLIIIKLLMFMTIMTPLLIVTIFTNNLFNFLDHLLEYNDIPVDIVTLNSTIINHY